MASWPRTLSPRRQPHTRRSSDSVGFTGAGGSRTQEFPLAQAHVTFDPAAGLVRREILKLRMRGRRLLCERWWYTSRCSGAPT